MIQLYRGTYMATAWKNSSWVLSVNRAIGLMSRMFANKVGDQISILGLVIPKTQKMVLDAALLKSQHYKVRIKGKVEQSREWSSSRVVATEKGAFESPSTKVANFTLLYLKTLSMRSDFCIVYWVVFKLMLLGKAWSCLNLRCVDSRTDWVP